ncbi:MAG: hypothetical protein JXR37_15645 [Kiritimatiellae bacterium]|nr:hypothetical protein [Kiritimatiellia bacterium]
MKRLFLLRYDTERSSQEQMAGFLEKAVAVHRADQIPATFFCRSAAVEAREDDFRAFDETVKDDPLFDIQDHSYSHIGLCYEAGSPVDVLKADYEKSFAIHERVFGKRPIGVSICGTSGKDGAGLKGFDETDKARAELDMMAGLGLRMINSKRVGVNGSCEFTNYAPLGHPEIMGFPSGYSDTGWMYRAEQGDPMDYILGQIKERAERDAHMPLMLHDWVAWNEAPDKELTHVRRIAEWARQLGYELVTHIACYGEKSLWAS